MIAVPQSKNVDFKLKFLQAYHDKVESIRIRYVMKMHRNNMKKGGVTDDSNGIRV